MLRTSVRLTLRRGVTSSGMMVGREGGGCCQSVKRTSLNGFSSHQILYTRYFSDSLPPTNQSTKHVKKSTDGSSEKASAALKYTRLTQMEHILTRPGMYIGGTALVNAEQWVWPIEGHLPGFATNGLTRKNVYYSPGLVKLFDEILVNAADNAPRPGSGMTRISVDITPTNPPEPSKPGLRIVIRNNGRSVPVVMHPTEKLYVPELIFGHLLTGTNFDDNSSRLTGGSHGYGAKLVNIFSDKFTVSIRDVEHGKEYVQNWEKNMSVCYPASISPLPQSVIDKMPTNAKKPSKGSYLSAHDRWITKESFTEVAFEPELSRFGYHDNMSNEEWEKTTSDLVSILRRRTLDIAGCLADKGVHVTLNGEPVKVSSFKDYVSQYNLSEVIAEAQLEAKSLLANKHNIVDPFEPELTAELAQKKGLEIAANKLAPLYSKIDDRWEVAVLPSTSRSYDVISFVNNVSTPRGGTHVNAIASQIVSHLEQCLKSKGLSSRPAFIRNQIQLFVNCSVDKAAFEGQSKDSLTTSSSLLRAPQLSKSFLSALEKSLVMERLLQETQVYDQSQLEIATKIRSSGVSKSRVLNIPKLEDARFAGGNRSNECTLLLTEGDSAKALAVAGLTEVGRDTYGVMPLRGKLLNVRMASKAQVAANAELISLCRVLGLKFSTRYDTPEARAKLRYGRVLLMTDQDHDGSHIKGLLINFFHHFWPELLATNEFLQEFITPIVKVSPKKKSAVSPAALAIEGGVVTPQGRSFYTLQDFSAWQESMVSAGEDLSTWHIKYYKGLGTNTSEEGKQYFRDIEHHRKTFSTVDRPEDRSMVVPLKLSSEEPLYGQLIDLAFNRERTSDRKQWLSTSYLPDEVRDHTATNDVSVSDFFLRDFVHFSAQDNVRSLPSSIDGLKPSQRKVLYGFLRRAGTSASQQVTSAVNTHGELGASLRGMPHLMKRKPGIAPVSVGEEIKVIQAAGYIAEHTCYHHGEASLHSTIVNMAQDYVGANNAPLLAGIGQFGTRARSGRDHASPRYIFTGLSPLARAIFPIADDRLLRYVDEDGVRVEPHHYVPIIPWLLVNGSVGIGTGWSTNVPGHSLLEICDVVEDALDALDREGTPQFEKALQLRPWVRGFTGKILPAKTLDNKKLENKTQQPTVYETFGRFNYDACTGNLSISELPVGVATEDYKASLLRLVEEGIVSRVLERHGVDSVRFEVILDTSASSLAPIYKLLDTAAVETMEASPTSNKTMWTRKHGTILKSISSDAMFSNDSSPSEKIATELLTKLLRLRSGLSLNNMHAFDENDRVTHFPNAQSIISKHFNERLSLYYERRRLETTRLAREELLANQKKRFVESLVSGELCIFDRRHDGLKPLPAREVIREMKKLGFLTTSEIADVSFEKAAELLGEPISEVKRVWDSAQIGQDKRESDNVDEEDEFTGGKSVLEDGFEYLLRLPVKSFVAENAIKYQKKATEATQRLETVAQTSVTEAWRADLYALRAVYARIYGVHSNEEQVSKKLSGKRNKKSPPNV